MIEHQNDLGTIMLENVKLANEEYASPETYRAALVHAQLYENVYIYTST